MDALTHEQIETLRRALETLVADLGRQLDSSEDGARPVDLDQPIGRLSRVDAMAQQQMLNANRKAAQRRRQQALAALRRIGEDEYGECRGCGEWIGWRRLEARPEAPFCIACQERRERR